MGVHTITFRLEKNRTYEERYESLTTAIKDISPRNWWAETTSFYLIVSDGSAAEVAARIQTNSEIDLKTDLLVVTNLSKKGYKVLGKLTDQDIHEIMKYR